MSHNLQAFLAEACGFYSLENLGQQRLCFHLSETSEDLTSFLFSCQEANLLFLHGVLYVSLCVCLVQLGDIKNFRSLMNIPEERASPEGASIDLMGVMDLNPS